MTELPPTRRRRWVNEFSSNLLQYRSKNVVSAAKHNTKVVKGLPIPKGQSRMEMFDAEFKYVRRLLADGVELTYRKAREVKCRHDVVVRRIALKLFPNDSWENDTGSPELVYVYVTPPPERSRPRSYSQQTVKYREARDAMFSYIKANKPRVIRVPQPDGVVTKFERVKGSIKTGDLKLLHTKMVAAAQPLMVGDGVNRKLKGERAVGADPFNTSIRKNLLATPDYEKKAPQYSRRGGRKRNEKLAANGELDAPVWTGPNLDEDERSLTESEIARLDTAPPEDDEFFGRDDPNSRWSALNGPNGEVTSDDDVDADWAVCPQHPLSRTSCCSPLVSLPNFCWVIGSLLSVTSCFVIARGGDVVGVLASLAFMVIMSADSLITVGEDASSLGVRYPILPVRNFLSIVCSSLSGSHGEWTQSDDVRGAKNWNDPHKKKVNQKVEGSNSATRAAALDNAAKQLSCVTVDDAPAPAPVAGKPKQTRSEKKASQAEAKRAKAEEKKKCVAVPVWAPTVVVGGSGNAEQPIVQAQNVKLSAGALASARGFPKTPKREKNVDVLDISVGLYEVDQSVTYQPAVEVVPRPSALAVKLQRVTNPVREMVPVFQNVEDRLDVLRRIGAAKEAVKQIARRRRAYREVIEEETSNENFLSSFNNKIRKERRKAEKELEYANLLNSMREGRFEAAVHKLEKWLPRRRPAPRRWMFWGYCEPTEKELEARTTNLPGKYDQDIYDEDAPTPIFEKVEGRDWSGLSIHILHTKRRRSRKWGESMFEAFRRESDEYYFPLQFPPAIERQSPWMERSLDVSMAQYMDDLSSLVFSIQRVEKREKRINAAMEIQDEVYRSRYIPLTEKGCEFIDNLVVYGMRPQTWSGFGDAGGIPSVAGGTSLMSRPTAIIRPLDVSKVEKFGEKLKRQTYLRRCKVAIIYSRDPIPATIFGRLKRSVFKGFARRVNHEYNPLIHESATAESNSWFGRMIYQEDYLVRNGFTSERHTLVDPALYEQVYKFSCGLNMGAHDMYRYLCTKFIRQGNSEMPIDLQMDTILKVHQDLLYRQSRDKLSCVGGPVIPMDGKL